jgi:hypothetical protein
VRGSDIIARSGGVIVEVRSPRARVVPVLARYHEPLLAAAAFAGTGLVHVEMLDRERKDLGPDYHDHGVLFCWPDGRPPHPDTIT